MYSWQVNGVNLVRIPQLTNKSQLVNKVVRDWLQNTEIKQRENFINIIYDILLATEVTDFEKAITHFARELLAYFCGSLNINGEYGYGLVNASKYWAKISAENNSINPNYGYHAFH